MASMRRLARTIQTCRSSTIASRKTLSPPPNHHVFRNTQVRCDGSTVQEGLLLQQVVVKDKDNNNIKVDISNVICFKYYFCTQQELLNNGKEGLHGEGYKECCRSNCRKKQECGSHCCFSDQSSGCVLDSEGLITYAELQFVS